MSKLESVSKNVDECLLDKCLKDICKQAALILERQRGNAYDFSDEKDSPEMTSKNLSDVMLDESETTNIKRVENYMGSLNRIITTTGPQGFDKPS